MACLPVSAPGQQKVPILYLPVYLPIAIGISTVAELCKYNSIPFPLDKISNNLKEEIM
jgi:hypothetical protein